jgi:DNA-damage-inducible protein D
LEPDPAWTVQVDLTGEKAAPRRSRGQGCSQLHYEAGVVDRRAIAELGGTMPKDMPTADSIKKLERAEKKRLTASKLKGKKANES